MIKHVVVVAGGQPNLWPDIARYRKQSTRWIGVDRGSLFLLEVGIVPDLAVGDFDSLDASELVRVEEVVSDIHYSKPEKDDTDTQLAIELALARYPEAEVILIGGTGGRLDHLLSNLWLPMEPRFQDKIRQIKLIDNQNSIAYFSPGRYQIEKEAGKNYLAFVCLTPIENLTLYDAKYQLENQQIMRPTSFASNEFIGTTSEFSFDAGTIAVIQSADG